MNPLTQGFYSTSPLTCLVYKLRSDLQNAGILGSRIPFFYPTPHHHTTTTRHGSHTNPNILQVWLRWQQKLHPQQQQPQTTTRKPPKRQGKKVFFFFVLFFKYLWCLCYYPHTLRGCLVFYWQIFFILYITLLNVAESTRRLSVTDAGIWNFSWRQKLPTIMIPNLAGGAAVCV